eukprot:jgi/Mesvir1/5263/Mv15377-RA.1
MAGLMRSSFPMMRTAMFAPAAAVGIAALARFNSTAAALVFAQHGAVENVIKRENRSVPDPKAGEVSIKMLAAPINPADINYIEGTYGVKPATLPAVAGLEGVGQVTALGAGVTSLKVGDWVVPAGASFGTWATQATVPALKVSKVPSSLPLEQAAVCSVSPCTALRLLSDFGALKKGDVVIQNCGSGNVGRSVVQIAKSLGVKTVSAVLDGPGSADAIEELKSLGGDVVVTESYLAKPEAKRLLSDLPAPVLALNGAGGSSATELARLLGKGGTLVTYGGMSRKPFYIPASTLIFKGITVKGFWLTAWLQEHSAAERQAMLDKVTSLMASGKLATRVETNTFDDFNKALAKARSPFNPKQVLKF